MISDMNMSGGLALPGKKRIAAIMSDSEPPPLFGHDPCSNAAPNDVQRNPPTMRLFAAAGFGAILLVSNAALAGSPEGTWLSQDGGTKVRVTHCGGKLCGTVVWLNSPTDPSTGKPRTDTHNPDPAKRARPLLGLQVTNGLRPNGPNSWSGLIYNADDGGTYRVNFAVENDTSAMLKGCVLGVLCKGQHWTRAD
jgi:uncharacterized protein (DUF2147 family)